MYSSDEIYTNIKQLLDGKLEVSLRKDEAQTHCFSTGTLSIVNVVCGGVYNGNA